MPASFPNLPVDSLAYRLLGAAYAAERVARGTALPAALAAAWRDGAVPETARGAMQDIAYRSMRQWGRANVLLESLAARRPQGVLHALLCCSLALLCDPDDAPYADFTLVDQAVAAAAAERKLAPAKGMVNAVLRRFLRERDALLAAAMREPQAAWNYPAWWIAAAQAAYPERWQAILAAGNAAPPLTLRVNRRVTTPDAYVRRLAEHGMGGAVIGADAVRLDRPVPVQGIPGFADGVVSVQDAAAQLAAPLLDLQHGMRVLDACAAPGGKSGHILECADVDLLATDIDAQRLARIEQNLQRLRLSARVAVGDASKDDWWDGMPFDRILADVPCTASGVVRRHPDIRWLRRTDDAGKLATVSAQILANLWRMVKPGGKLLLVTCSIWPQESEQQAAAFASAHGAVRLDAPGQLLPSATEQSDHDGLFYALFEKPADAGSVTTSEKRLS